MAQEDQDIFMNGAPTYLNDEQLARAKEIADLEAADAALALVERPELIPEYCAVMLEHFISTDDKDNRKMSITNAYAAVGMIDSTMREVAKLAKKDK